MTFKTVSKLDQTKKFKSQLHKNYSCGVIFIDLKESENNNASIITELSIGRDVIGFTGGMVLRYENDHSITGLIVHHNIEPRETEKVIHYTPLAKPIDELNIYATEDGNIKLDEIGSGVRLVVTSENTWSVSKSYGVTCDNGDTSIYLYWSRSNFSEFCVDLISRLEGLAFNDQKRPSFGRIFDSINRKSAELQGSSPDPEMPFMEISLCSGSENGNQFEIETDSDFLIIKIWLQIENLGSNEAKISDDQFKTSCLLPAGKKATKSLNLQFRDTEGHLKELINKEGLDLPYRLVYQPTGENKNFFAIEKIIKIGRDEITIH